MQIAQGVESDGLDVKAHRIDPALAGVVARMYRAGWLQSGLEPQLRKFRVQLTLVDLLIKIYLFLIVRSCFFRFFR